MFEEPRYSVHYRTEGCPVTEDYASALGALGRIGALISKGIGENFEIYSGPRLLLNEEAIFESLQFTRH